MMETTEMIVPDIAELYRRYIELRNLIKQQRNLNSVTFDTQKMTFFCKTCQEDHTVGEKNYFRNIKRNGRYICSKEANRLTGLKRMGFVEDGRKQCSGCKKILDFENFSKDSSRRSGLSPRCRVCRSKAAKRNVYRRKAS